MGIDGYSLSLLHRVELPILAATELGRSAKRPSVANRYRPPASFSWIDRLYLRRVAFSATCYSSGCNHPTTYTEQAESPCASQIEAAGIAKIAKKSPSIVVTSSSSGLHCCGARLWPFIATFFWT